MHTTVLKAVESELGCALESLGSSALLSRPRCAILVSRGERTPEPLSPQLLEALGAARAISARGAVLVCGAGRVIWDAALLACRESKGSALVVLAQRPDDAELRELHSFLPADRLLVWPQFERTKLLTPTMLLVRDMLVGLLAESAVAIQVRANGNMAAVCAEMRKRGGQIEERILQPQAKIKTAPRAQAIESKSAAGVADIESFEHRLTHFTRAPDGAWPGEAHVDYLRWLCGAERSEMRDGFAALKRILSERRIRACGRLIADKEPMVCFTAADPRELLKRRIWRKGLRRWTVSSYALSFPARALEWIGVQPVKYIDAEVSHYDVAPYFTQPSASAGVNWEFEAEWRLQGDFDFSHLAAKDIVALAPTHMETERLEREFGVRTALLNFPEK